MNGSSQKHRRRHLQVVRSDEEPRRVPTWNPLMVGLNLLAVGFVAFVGYERAGLRGAVVLTAVALAVAWGFRHAGRAADNVTRRNRRPPSA